MSRLLIEIRCDTPAFGGSLPEHEIAYVLVRFVDKITSWGRLPIDGSSVMLRDSNGAHVGQAKLEVSLPSATTDGAFEASSAGLDLA